MPAAPLLDEKEVAARLRALEGWVREGDRLVKRYRFRDFTGALAFVNAIAVPAERQNHHPDVTIHWNEVTLSLWTHASGGITERDLRLAAEIDRTAEE